MNRAQKVLEDIPELPDLIPIYGARNFLSMEPEDMTGFYHSNGEWNYLVKHNNRMYRVPKSNMQRRAISECGPINIGGE